MASRRVTTSERMAKPKDADFVTDTSPRCDVRDHAALRDTLAIAAKEFGSINGW
jgi:hypothetical protein